MNIKRFFIAALALFVFIFAFEYVMHGILLTNIYSETPQIWRSNEDMAAYIPFNIAIMAMIAIWITFFFTRIYKNGGLNNGFKFGVYLGVLSGIQAAGAYFYLPISAMLATAWFAIYLAESVIGGLIIGAIYKA